MTTPRPVVENQTQQLLAPGTAARKSYRHLTEAVKQANAFNKEMLVDSSGKLRDDVVAEFHNNREKTPELLEDIGLDKNIHGLITGYSPDGSSILYTKHESGVLLSLDARINNENLEDIANGLYSVEQVKVLELPSDDVLREKIIGHEMDKEEEIERLEKLYDSCKNLDDPSQLDGYTMGQLVFGKDGFYGGAQCLGYEEGVQPEVTVQENGLLLVGGNIEIEIPRDLEGYFHDSLELAREDLVLADPKLDPAKTPQKSPEQSISMDR